MKKLFFTIIAALAALLTSCSHEAEEIARITTISASTDQSTRAVVDPFDNTYVNWESRDQLGVLGTNSSSASKNLAFTLSEGADSPTGKFDNSGSDITTISAIMYPHQEGAKLNAETLTCEIPSVQTAPPGSFDKSAAIMYAFGNSTNAQLNLAVNFLAITLSAEDPMPNSIIITSSNALTGKMEITSDGVSAASTGAENSVTLTSGSASPLAAGEYYIAVKRGNIDNPTITYTYYDNDAHTATIKSKAGSGSIVFTSGKNVKPIKVSFTDTDTHKAVQLWDNGPYFAEFNVGATATSYEDATYDAVCGRYFTWSAAFNAVKSWGPMWQLPTQEQLNMRDDNDDLLVSWVQCDGSGSQFIEGCGIKGYKITGNNGNSIFFPAAGYGEGGANNRGDAYDWEGDIYYWSRNEEEGTAKYLNCILYNEIFSPDIQSSNKTSLFPVRPILNNPL